MNTREYIARVHEEDDGSFWAEVLELPGCFASGESLDELKAAIEEAISLYLEDEQASQASGSPARPSASPRHAKVGELRVSVPSG